MISIDRGVVVEELARVRLASLSDEERSSYVTDWWSIDADEPGFADLPPSLQVEVSSGDVPVDAAATRFDPLILVALRYELDRYRNSYLAAIRDRWGLGSVVVGGAEPVLATCPVCEYQTLDPPGFFEICQVCGWQHDGFRDPDAISGANGVSLNRAKALFDGQGHVDENISLAEDRFDRYNRSD